MLSPITLFFLINCLQSDGAKRTSVVASYGLHLVVWTVINKQSVSDICLDILYPELLTGNFCDTACYIVI